VIVSIDNRCVKFTTHVESGIDDGEVEREQEDNRFLEKQNPRSTKSGLEELANFHLFVLFKLASVNSSSRLAKCFGTLSQKNRGISLGDEEGSNNGQDTSKDRKKSGNPSPPSSFTQKSSDLKFVSFNRSKDEKGLTIGPTAGPRKGAAAKMAIPNPRSPASKRSETVPPALVKGEDPAVPARNRKMMSVQMF
jgi:hypothetical protein